jgi:hypothetical protein
VAVGSVLVVRWRPSGWWYLASVRVQLEESSKRPEALVPCEA